MPPVTAVTGVAGRFRGAKRDLDHDWHAGCTPLPYQQESQWGARWTWIWRVNTNTMTSSSRWARWRWRWSVWRKQARGDRGTLRPILESRLTRLRQQLGHLHAW